MATVNISNVIPQITGRGIHLIRNRLLTRSNRSANGEACQHAGNEFPWKRNTFHTAIFWLNYSDAVWNQFHKKALRYES